MYYIITPFVGLVVLLGFLAIYIIVVCFILKEFVHDIQRAYEGVGIKKWIAFIPIYNLFALSKKKETPFFKTWLRTEVLSFALTLILCLFVLDAEFDPPIFGTAFLENRYLFLIPCTLIIIIPAIKSCLLLRRRIYEFNLLDSILFGCYSIYALGSIMIVIFAYLYMILRVLFG